MRTIAPVLATVLTLCVAVQTAHTGVLNPSGSSIWDERGGFGITLGVGGGDCTRDYCRYGWDTSLFPSLALSAGLMYRLNPNWIFFAEVNNGFADARKPFRAEYFNNGSTFDTSWIHLFDATAGAEFHLPVTGWLDLYAGAGLGFSYMSGRATSGPLNDRHHTLKGLGFQFRLGGDLYLFSAAPSFSLGPIIKIGTPVWTNACVEDGPTSECHGRSDFGQFDDIHELGNKRELPFTLFLGFASRYVF